jgi:hypothetical protein
VSTQPVVDVGEVRQGIAKGEFEVINTSDKKVTILTVVKTCRCTDIALSNSDVLPNQKTKISLHWDTRAMRGKQSNMVTLIYSIAGDDRKYSLELFVRGDVMPSYYVIPDVLEFSRKKDVVKNVRLVSHDVKLPIKINCVTCSFQGFDVEKLSDHEVSISFAYEKWKDDTGIVPFFGIETDCETEKHINVPIILLD